MCFLQAPFEHCLETLDYMVTQTPDVNVCTVYAQLCADSHCPLDHVYAGSAGLGPSLFVS